VSFLGSVASQRVQLLTRDAARMAGVCDDLTEEEEAGSAEMSPRSVSIRVVMARYGLPRAGGGGSVPPSASVFMFWSALLKTASRPARSFARAASSASIELS